MLESAVKSIEQLLDMFTSGFGKKNITDYVDIETVNDNYTLVSKDGSLITLLDVRGNLDLYDPQEYLNKCHSLETKLSSLFEKKEYKVQLFFEYDHDNTRKELREVMSEARKTIKVTETNLEDVLQEREENLLEYVCSEKFYIALWTTTGAMSKSQMKNQKERLKERAAEKTMPITILGQDPLRASLEIVEKHQSFVSSFVRTLAEAQIMTRQMDVRGAIREMRKCFDKKFTEETWTPFIPGDKILPSVRKTSPSMDTYDIMYPKMSHQIAPSTASMITEDFVEMGDRIYGSMFFELFPQNIFSFQTLFNTARAHSLPWRYSLLIEGGGLKDFRYKGLAAQLLSFSNSGNKLIKQDLDSLKDYNQSGSIVEVRATFTTWAPKGEVRLLNTRFENLKNALGSWGNPEVSKTTGDPFAALASTSLAATQGNIGTKSAAPLNEIAYMSPFLRPCSVWENGSGIFRSPDGKILPYEPFSSKQAAWVEIIAAGMGAGKSVLMSFLNLALCLNPNIKELPRIAIIDNGPSSSGFISLLKESLPKHKQHLVLSHKFKNVKEQSINPLDTMLGAREPTALERSFLYNFISLLATDPTEKEPPKGLSGLIPKVLEKAYFMKSDKEKPNIYSKGNAIEVDLALYELSKQDILLDAFKEAQKEGLANVEVPWWSIVDFLFENGKINEAKLAQRHAVPTVLTLIEAVTDEKIRSEYTEEERNAFIRNIKDSLSFYPVLSGITQFDVDLARIVSLDLDEVSKGSGAVNERMTVVMYMIARYVLGKDFYTNEEVVDEVPVSKVTKIELNKTTPVQAYKDFHYKRGIGLVKEQKRLVYDEFHRVSLNPSSYYIVKQVEDDIRVGRKYQIDIMLASQSLTDFNENLINLSTAVFVLDGKSQQVVNNVKNLLGMKGETVENILQHQIRGPGKGGGVFLARFALKDKTFTSLMSATLGPIEIWAFSTTAADVFVRNGLYKRMKSSDARRLLAKYYPSGSIKSVVEEMLEQKQRSKMQEKNAEFMIGKEEENDIYEEILEQLIGFARKEGYIVN